MKSDKELIVDYLSGQDDALPTLINRHLPTIYRFLFGLVLDRAVAEDITQEVFLKVWKKLKSYNERYSFKTWLFSIARNTAIDYLRKNKDIPFSSFENEAGDNVLTDTLVDHSPLPDEILAKVEDTKFFTDLLRQLPNLYREVLVLRYTNDLSVEEIATMLRRPVETVKSQLRRGQMHLKKLLVRIY